MLFLQSSLARCGWVLTFGLVLATQVPAEEWRDIPLKSRVEGVQPHTGIVLWASGADVDPRTIQLEFSYMKYGDVVTERGRYDWDAVEQVLDAAAETGTAIEINASLARLDAPATVIREGVRRGVTFVISTDAHAVAELDRARLGVAQARRGGAGTDRIANTWHLDAFLDWLRSVREA
jgi:hypothetical protein